MRRYRTLIAPAVLALVLLCAPAQAIQRQVRIGTVPAVPAGSTPLAGVAASASMRLTVALVPRSPSALGAYAAAVSDPTSPYYRAYLRPAAFAARFGASPAAVAAVRRALGARGLTVGALASNRLSLTVTGDAAAVEHAFDITLERFAVPGLGPAVLSSAAPAVDARIAPDVQAVIGLDGLARMSSPRERPADAGETAASKAAVSTPGAVVHRTPSRDPQACAAASGTATAEGAYTAGQIASAYGATGLYDAGNTGSGVTVALYELEPVSASDIAAYQACYGTDTSVSYESVDGGAGSGAGSGEAAFDIEQLIGLAPGVRILVYEGPNTGDNDPGTGPYDTFAQIIASDRAQVVSNSWGECEQIIGSSTAQAEYALFEEAAVQGQTVVSAAGDNGSEDCTGEAPFGQASLAVDDPASQPYVTGVGGTSMTAAGTPPAQTVWNTGGGSAGRSSGSATGAGGGGISTFWKMPSYQASAGSSDHVIGASSSAAPCDALTGYCREVPDVSADADPSHGYLIYFNGLGSASGPRGWQASGGTSGAAPLWAAFFALADADPACGGLSIGFANPLLYALAATPGYLDDITSGNNDYTGAGDGRWAAGVGYDMASGLGTPDASALAAGLCADALRLRSPGDEQGYAWSAVHVALDVDAPAAATLSVSVAGLPRGVSFDPARELISGVPRAPGRHLVTVTARAGNGTQRVLSFEWTVAGRPVLSPVVVSRSAGGVSTVLLSVRAGAFAPDLRRVSVTLPGGITLSATRRRPSARTVLSAVVRSTGARVALDRAAHTHALLATVSAVDAHGTVVRERVALRLLAASAARVR